MSLRLRQVALLSLLPLVSASCLMSRFQIDDTLGAAGSGGGGSSAGTASAAGKSAKGGDGAPGDGGTPSDGGAPIDEGGKTSTGGQAGTGGANEAGTTTTGGMAGANAGSGGTAGVTGGGGSGGSGEAGAGGVCDGKTRVLQANQGFIDNFESEARFASWSAFSDTTPPNSPAMARTAGGAVSTAFAGSASATGIKTTMNFGYGAGFTFNFMNSEDACLDISAFDGFSFWIRGSVAGSGQLFVMAKVPETVPVTEGGDCPASSSGCYLHPRKIISVSNSWVQHAIKWTDLISIVPEAEWDHKHLQGLAFVVDDTSYDVSIDEVTFYAGNPPPGAIKP